MAIRNLPKIVKATALGVLTMYIFDPVSGRRRRALARDKLVRVRNDTREAVQVTALDLKNRIWGTVAEGRAALIEGTVDDSVLAERVRSKLGFLVRHPPSLDVQATSGRVILIGPVLADEVQQLIEGVRSVRGVRDVENRLEVHERGDDVPGLQGDVPKPTGELPDVFQGRWSPSTRFLLGTAGIVLLFGLNPFRRAAARLSLLAGLGLLACSVAEEERKEITRSRQGNGEVGEVSAGWSG
ncbi:MAG TPA: BON domain-containing protein [Candidatus Binatia bacterium]|nr:BON domain-containing protein [Candidatus Binatia bacterium]